jgi:hypothetical protein
VCGVDITSAWCPYIVVQFFCIHILSYLGMYMSPIFVCHFITCLWNSAPVQSINMTRPIFLYAHTILGSLIHIGTSCNTCTHTNTHTHTHTHTCTHTHAHTHTHKHTHTGLDVLSKAGVVVDAIPMQENRSLSHPPCARPPSPPDSIGLTFPAHMITHTHTHTQHTHAMTHTYTQTHTNTHPPTHSAKTKGGCPRPGNQARNMCTQCSACKLASLILQVLIRLDFKLEALDPNP